MSNLYRRLWLLLTAIGFSLILTTVAQATHIVGGEIEVLALGPNQSFTHRVNLNMYFDNINGDPGAIDPTVILAIYARTNNALIGTITLPNVSRSNVNYTNPTCITDRLSTLLVRYSTDVSFPTTTNDPRGYYIVWERCCRNGTISNLTRPGDAGAAFYLEFPAPYTSSGVAYRNSSPVFNAIKGDYICVNRPFTFDFGAKDADGDSLTYTMVTPYNGYSASQPTNLRNPAVSGIFSSGPYPDVSWASGFSAVNSIPGPQPLAVDRTGQLRTTAQAEGLYVFSVEVKEFRRGIQIGRVRRDFQFLVVDCPKNDAPQLLFRPDGQRTFYTEGNVLTIAEKDTNCLTLYVTDINPNQRIQLVNMSGSLPGLTLTPGELLTRTGRDTLQAKFCFGRCVGDGRPFTLLIRATDEGCPQGLSDTLNIRLNIVPSPNTKPLASTNLPNNRSRITVGSSLSFVASGLDMDNDNISIQAVGRGFTLAQAGMNFGSASGVGKVSQPFTWKPTCTQATRSEYIVDFVVTDTRCNRNLRDTVTVNLGAVGLPSQPPSIKTTSPQPVVELIVSPNADVGRAAFDVLGDDPDRDTLLLTGTGRGFDVKAVGMTFQNKTGSPTLQSPFGWKPTCELLAGRAEATFVVDFVVDDRSCQPQHTDTTTVTFVLKDPSVSAEIMVPNVFTPNGDGKNDYFTVKDLPENSCTEQFKSVEIVNRWGKVVFTSTDPKFRWSGADSPVGTYYYLILTSKRTFKGPLTLIR